MPEEDAPSGQEKSYYQKLTSREFLNISAWTIGFVFKISPKNTTIFALTTVLSRLADIGNTLILAKIIDTLVESIQTKNISVEEIFLLLAFVFLYDMLVTIVDTINGVIGRVLYISGRPAIRREFYRKINSLGIQTLEQPDVNNLIHRADMSLGNMVGYLDDTLRILAGVVRFIVLFGLVTSFFPIFAVLIIVAIVPYLLFDKKYRTKLYSFIDEQTESARKVGSVSYHLTDSRELQEINITNAFNFLDNKYWNFHSWYTKVWIGILTKWRLINNSLNIFSYLIVIICSAKVFIDAFNSLISVGTAVFRYRILEQFQSSIRSTIRDVNDLTEQAVRISDVYRVFRLLPAFSEGGIPFNKLDKGPGIVLEKVRFKYPNADKYVIQNLSLAIKSGEKVAIVGPNGAGKTTLVKLICKLYQVNSGKIKINGKLLNDVNIKDWHKNIGVLFQDYNVYSELTVKENILIGNADEPVDELAIRLAAEQADAAEFINEYPQGFEQTLSEKYRGGIRPSTGQWQKLAIARFFYRNAPLVIFDEPTASIDAISEYNIFNRIYEFFKNKTVIIISHRFSTVRNADRIIVLDKGSIVEEGNHDQLMSQGGKYAQAFLLQAKGYVETIV